MNKIRRKIINYLLLLVAIAIILGLMVSQNDSTIKVKLFAWEIEIMMAYALIASMLVGMTIAFLLALPTKIKASRENNKQQKRLDVLEKLLQDEMLKNAEAKNNIEATKTKTEEIATTANTNSTEE